MNLSSLASQWLRIHLPIQEMKATLVRSPGSSPEVENGNPLQYTCQENPMDRGAWQVTVNGVTKSQTQLNDCHFHFILIIDMSVELLFIFICFFCLFLFFKFYFLFKLYNIVLVLPNIEMNPPQVYMCSPSWTLLPPPSPYHPSGSLQCTSPKHPVSCIEPGLATRFIYDIIRISMPFSQIIPPSPSRQSEWLWSKSL